MHFFIDRDEFSRGLAHVQGVVERRSTQPVLSHVLLHAREGGLRLTATDTEVAFIGELAANVDKGGEIAVDAANLFQVVRSLPEATVEISGTSNNRLEIKCGRSHFKLPGMAAEEYPALPAFDARGSAKIGEGTLRRLVDQTGFAIATDDARYGLNGAHLEERSDGERKLLRCVSTDGHRLSIAEGEFQGTLAITPRMLVPRKALAVMRKLLEGDGEVEIAFGEGAVRLTRAPNTFWFRLLDGEFPDYKAVVPKQGKHKVRLRRDDLASTLKRVGILVQDRARAVRFAFDEASQQVDIQVHNVDRGEVDEKIGMELAGPSITVGFNVRYLQDILGVLAGDHILLEIDHPLGPCLVRDPDEELASFVVMPMRLD
jgi:DNA polymerase-3 subunit beta